MQKRALIVGVIAASLASHVLARDPSPDTYSPYTKKGYAKTFKKWGSKGVAKINSYRKAAALKVAEIPSCDNVEYADLSDNRSSPPDNIVVFVDCTNGQRFYLTSAELDSNEAASSNQEKTASLNDSDLISACEKSILSSLKFPSSFDKSWFSTNVYRAPQGNVVVTFDFTAKNGFGMNLPQQARCVVDDRGMHPPEISNR